MGCGKSKHAVATATAPTAVTRKRSTAKKSTGDASKDRREDDIPSPSPPLPDQNLSSEDNGNAAAGEAKREAEPGKLISRGSPSGVFSSHKDAELIAAAIGDAKSDGDDSEYGSPRAESAGSDDALPELNVHNAAADGGEKAAAAVVEAAREGAAAVESAAPETKLQHKDGDSKVEEVKLEGSSAEIGKAM
ncbi:unnamed protein product [Linum trigynum]|uniref:Uncharacterized protein n=1 Tax=Linum trigynum TaxID=586398 RepID=A0AAV2GVJ2_9ROSI